MRGAIQIQKGMRGFWGQNTLQHLADLQLHFHLRWTNECKDSDDSHTQSMTSTSTDDELRFPQRPRTEPAFPEAGTRLVFPHGELPDGYELLIPLRRSLQPAA